MGRIGTKPFAWPVAAVERVLGMAAVTHVADLPGAVTGLLDLHGETLPVVDPRPRLGLAGQAAHPDQHLLLFAAPARYLLWVDHIDSIVAVDASEFEPVASDHGATSAPFITRIDGQLVPILSPEIFDPGQIIGRARSST